MEASNKKVKKTYQSQNQKNIYNILKNQNLKMI